MQYIVVSILQQYLRYLQRLMSNKTWVLPSVTGPDRQVSRCISIFHSFHVVCAFSVTHTHTHCRSELTYYNLGCTVQGAKAARSSLFKMYLQ